jgi:putative transposase
VKYLIHVVERDYRRVRRVTRPMPGFKSFETAQGTLVGIELIHMLEKGQMALDEGVESLTPPA